MATPALVPVVIAATGAIRMVGAPIAKALASRGIVSKATAKQVKNFGKNIPKMSRQMQGKLTKEGARNVARRTPTRGPGGRKLTQLEKQKLMRENIQKGKNAPTSSTTQSKIDKVSNATSGAEKASSVKKSVDKAMKKKSDEKALQAKEQATQRSISAQRSIAERIAQRKKAESAGKRNLPSKPQAVPARGTSGRPSATPANAAGRNLSTSINKPVAPRPRPKPDMKTVGSSKVPARGTSGRPSATPANASGLRSLAAKQTVKPQTAVVGTDTKKNPKKDPVGSGQTPASGYVESKRKPKRNPVGSGQTPASGYVESKPSKTSSKFKDEGGKYKQYEWAKKLDPSDPRFQSGYMTQKGYDSEEMEAAKKGGQIKKLTKTKKVVKKKTAPKKSTAKKRNNFSGRGAGAALRGF